MDNKILKRYMMFFSTEQLKKYLGEDLLESLFEWQNDNESIFTKSKLSEMLININGLKILKQKEFREELLKKFEPETIQSFKEVLPKKYEKITDLAELVKIISNQPWKKSLVSKHFLEILGYDLDLAFEKKHEKGEVIKTVQSHDKFYELLDYQYIIRQKALTKLTSGEELEKMLIHMPTGTGKTKTATHIICHHYNYNLKKKGLVIWIAHTTELLQQAYDTFCSVWKNIGNGEINTYKLWGKYDINHNIDQLSGFMVCSIQKLYSISINDSKLFERLKQEIKLIVYDEAHKASAPESRKIINELMTKKDNMEDRALIGLSAMPGRNNGISFDNKLLASTFDRMYY